jgi:hypothetical protein
MKIAFREWMCLQPKWMKFDCYEHSDHEWLLHLLGSVLSLSLSSIMLPLLSLSFVVPFAHKLSQNVAKYAGTGGPRHGRFVVVDACRYFVFILLQA